MPPTFRISPLWWPGLSLASPLIAPMLLLRYRRFTAGRREAAQHNARRIDRAVPLDLPALSSLSLTVVVEAEHEEGFLSDPAVSYLFRSDRGTLLMDVGFGPATPVFGHNTERLGLTMDGVDALLITHLHLDHMGGLAAQRARRVAVPEGFAGGVAKPCYLPAEADASGFDPREVNGPRCIEAGLATTGPLARRLFFYGLMEEQALVAHLEGKGLVVVTRCGPPTVEVILEMARRLCDAPLYAVVGGLHFPITRSRSRRWGLEAQRLFGTGKPVWRQVTEGDLERTIEVLNAAAPKRLYLSPHDSCNLALDRLEKEVLADVQVLRAGGSYEL
jgi:7,8-dihydropterin-6-yl-methyl-4-(beta-D-ribofuranosyl)aminobenzene 5'-phosphate synthase